MAFKEMTDLFSKESIDSADFALDHYIPWSYVAHDELWNLHPTTKYSNSIKGNKIPLNKYNSGFTRTQFDFMQFLLINRETVHLRTYLQLFSCSTNSLSRMEYEQFHQLLSNELSLSAQIAQNMGFEMDWTYPEMDT
jgi:hypothetical protein